MHLLTSLLPGKSSDVHFTRGPTYYTSVVPASGQLEDQDVLVPADQVRQPHASNLFCLLKGAAWFS